MLTAYEKPTYSNHIYANINNRWLQKLRARMPEWSKGADLRSAGESRVGSNPTPCTKNGSYSNYAIIFRY